MSIQRSPTTSMWFARTRNMHIYPARHDAGSNNPSYPPMGLRVRLKASFDMSGYSPEAQVILQALKTCGDQTIWQVLVGSLPPSPVY